MVAPSNKTGTGAKAPVLPSLTMKSATFNALLEARHQFLRFLERRVRDHATAEDILQGAYLRSLEAGGQLRADHSAVAWFYRVLRNAVVDHYRRRASEGAALDRWAQEPARENVPEPDGAAADGCPCVAAALEGISPDYADLLRAVDLGQIRLVAYAKGKGITAGNAAVRAHRARTALRRRLMRSCGGCAANRCVECTCGKGA